MSVNKRALVTGFGGQDSYYLCQLLLERGYDIVATSRSSQRLIKGYITPLSNNIDIEQWNLLDKKRFADIVLRYKPDLIFNLAALSSGEDMNSSPLDLAKVNGFAVLNMLETIKDLSLGTRFIQASSSEVFGDAIQSPQTESSARNPRSAYGVSKLFADGIIKFYRRQHNQFCVSAILYNHESPLREVHFVTRKITQTVAAIAKGNIEKLTLGNLSANRDWGHARDTVDGMLKIGLAEVADDFILATGITHTIREFVEESFKCVGINLEWSGQGIDELGTCCATGKVRVAVSPLYFRPEESGVLVGDASKAKAILGWAPKVNFTSLVHEMVNFDINAFSVDC